MLIAAIAIAIAGSGLGPAAPAHADEAAVATPALVVSSGETPTTAGVFGAIEVHFSRGIGPTIPWWKTEGC